MGADDGVLRPKPESRYVSGISEKFGLKPQEIAVVGDTYNDIRLQRKRGVAIGVFKRSGVRKQIFAGKQIIY